MPQIIVVTVVKVVAAQGVDSLSAISVIANALGRRWPSYTITSIAVATRMQVRKALAGVCF